MPPKSPRVGDLGGEDPSHDESRELITRLTGYLIHDSKKLHQEISALIVRALFNVKISKTKVKITKSNSRLKCLKPPKYEDDF